MLFRLKLLQECLGLVPTFVFFIPGEGGRTHLQPALVLEENIHSNVKHVGPTWKMLRKYLFKPFPMEVGTSYKIDN